MANVLFTNVRILDATGAQPYPGEVMVQGNRIQRVTRTTTGARSAPAPGVTVIDGRGGAAKKGQTPTASTGDKTTRIPPAEVEKKLRTDPAFKARLDLA